MDRRSIAVVVLLMTALLAVSVPVAAETVNVLKNGSFEEEFIYGVGKSWGHFNNGGSAAYGYHDDTWDRVTYDGEHSQLIEIHTNAVGGSEKDRYTGIYQAVDVVPGARYMCSLYGMIRSTEGTEQQSSWNYRVQVGYDFNGGNDPWAVTDWIEMSWPETHRLSPGRMQSFARGVTATSDRLTVFIRVWKKFPTRHQEGNINIDAVSLLGPAPAAAAPAPEVAAQPEASVQETVVEQPVAQPVAEPPAAATIPDTGAGEAVAVVGAGLAIVAIALTSKRVLGPKT